MIYKYSVHHHIGRFAYFRKHISIWLSRNVDRWVAPIDSSVQCCFVVGCGHSGTTLTAAKLGNHSKVMAIGYESNIFRPTRSISNPKRSIVGWLRQVGAEGKTHLLEKTPKHVHVLPQILRLLPQAKIVVTVRNPMDNCFSLYERFGCLEYAIDRWLADNQAACDAINNPAVKFVKYEQLTADPERGFAEICEFLGLPKEGCILGEQRTVFEREFGDTNMNLRREQVRKAIKPSTGRWRQKWSPAQIETVRARTTSVASRLGYTEGDLA